MYTCRAACEFASASLSVYVSCVSCEERKAKETLQTDRRESIETGTGRESEIMVPIQTPDVERRTVGQGIMNDANTHTHTNTLLDMSGSLINTHTNHWTGHDD